MSFSAGTTAEEAKAAVSNGQAIAPACPPSAPPVNTSVVCRYAIGRENGLAMFSYTAKDVNRYYISR
jgi:hypothetical protein